MDSSPLQEKLQSSPAFFVLMFFGLLFFAFGLVGICITTLQDLSGMTVQAATASLGNGADLNTRNFVRIANNISQIFIFILPPIALIFLTYKEGLSSYFRLDHIPNWYPTVIGVLFLLAVFPIASWSFEINALLPLPAELVALEEQYASLTKGLMVMEYPKELVFNLVTIALIPAIAEELMFRGLIQNQLERWLKKPHLAIWLAAIIFSAIHFQFLGFLPRMLLGAGLGYLYYFTRNLWIPILGHFLNNGLQVLAYYYANEEQLANLESNEAQISILIVAVCLIFVVGLGYLLQQYQRKNNHYRNELEQTTETS